LQILDFRPVLQGMADTAFEFDVRCGLQNVPIPPRARARSEPAGRRFVHGNPAVVLSDDGQLLLVDRLVWEEGLMHGK